MSDEPEKESEISLRCAKCKMDCGVLRISTASAIGGFGREGWARTTMCDDCAYGPVEAPE
jgi:hypothetical protein